MTRAVVLSKRDKEIAKEREMYMERERIYQEELRQKRLGEEKEKPKSEMDRFLDTMGLGMVTREQLKFAMRAFQPLTANFENGPKDIKVLNDAPVITSFDLVSENNPAGTIIIDSLPEIKGDNK